PMSAIFAQDITDALRYSTENIQGSARFSSMGGAFGALGGDMSAVSLNPAGSAIFTRSNVSLSFSALGTDNKVGFLNRSLSSDESDFDMHQFGGAFVFANRNIESPWKKFVLSIAYDRVGNYDDNWFASGTNTSSVDNYFLQNAQGKRLDEISAFEGETLNEAYADIGSAFGYPHQQAFLGYESFIIDPVINSDGNTNYISNIGSGTFEQDYAYISTGFNGKISFNAAAQYGDRLYMGLNLNAHYFEYERSTLLFESNANPDSFVSEIDFRNTLLASGDGFSFQLGAIYKFTEEFRGGIVYKSPTWLSIFEETTQYISTDVDDGESQFIQTINPRTVNIFPEYRLKTPGSITGGLAYVFDDKGLLSFDYSRKDYGNIEFRPTSDPVFVAQNNNISNELKAASTYRFGGEYRYLAWSFRGGYHFEESPYEDENFYGDLSGYSLGLGYSFGNLKLDLSYLHSARDYNQRLYQSGLTNAANIQSDTDIVSLTLGFSI
ncbi:MAG: outer membrane protein transport protein, partial [Flavobacteriaceae bacterium]|nr:outer membrane protein transport protein [Flavobacteriaceae bacterium]